ncbi:dienelactone hydrolase family protein [Aquabacterium sp.]|uniref:dienelactone hydrolase family protein n=1 Tax=Aquabacterium sp. TaxID=1872578 RepID=UPI0035ADABBF
MGQMITFSRPDGAQSNAYLAEAGAGRPGVILIQEWWGLNDNMKTIADRLAAAGFTTLAPDLYRGRLASSADEASHMMNGLDFPDATHQDIRGATAYLSERCSKVAVMGFCMGGALTIASAVHVPGLSAAVCFYGIPPREFADPANIRIPFMGHFASLDGWCTPEAVNELEQRMQGSGALRTFCRYEGVDHAFFNKARPEVYDAASAELAWDRTVAFLAEVL